MSSPDRIEELRAEHRQLENTLDEEIRRPLPNLDLVTDLKRQKLRIKDQIVKLQHARH